MMYPSPSSTGARDEQGIVQGERSSASWIHCCEKIGPDRFRGFRAKLKFWPFLD